jgi:hypothetical protein
MFGVEKLNRHRKRAILSSQQAGEIFLLREAIGSKVGERSNSLVTSKSNMAGAKYGISAKAVRDIWNRRTWRHATRIYWGEADILEDSQSPHCYQKSCSASISKKQVDQHNRSTTVISTTVTNVGSQQLEKLNETPCVFETSDFGVINSRPFQQSVHEALEGDSNLLGEDDQSFWPGSNDEAEYQECEIDESNLQRYYPFFLC